MAGDGQRDARTPPDPPAEFGRWPFWRRWFGRRSERFAARYLRKLGWRVLAANVADREGELDLLALDGDTLVVVEVRSRSVPDPQEAADSVDLVKQRRLTEATVRFLSRRRLLGTNVRFDVLALGWPAGAREPAVLHVRHAFEATGRFQFFS
jgi:putative endonuclease